MRVKDGQIKISLSSSIFILLFWNKIKTNVAQTTRIKVNFMYSLKGLVYVLNEGSGQYIGQHFQTLGA